jgi:hypothetical protein
MIAKAKQFPFLPKGIGQPHFSHQNKKPSLDDCEGFSFAEL